MRYLEKLLKYILKFDIKNRNDHQQTEFSKELDEFYQFFYRSWELFNPEESLNSNTIYKTKTKFLELHQSNILNRFNSLSREDIETIKLIHLLSKCELSIFEEILNKTQKVN